MIPPQATLTTGLTPEQPSKIYQMIGCARNAALKRMNSSRSIESCDTNVIHSLYRKADHNHGRLFYWSKASSTQNNTRITDNTGMASSVLTTTMFLANSSSAPNCWAIT